MMKLSDDVVEAMRMMDRLECINKTFRDLTAAHAVRLHAEHWRRISCADMPWRWIAYSSLGIRSGKWRRKWWIWRAPRSVARVNSFIKLRRTF